MIFPQRCHTRFHFLGQRRKTCVLTNLWGAKFMGCPRHHSFQVRPCSRIAKLAMNLLLFVYLIRNIGRHDLLMSLKEQTVPVISRHRPQSSDYRALGTETRQRSLDMKTFCCPRGHDVSSHQMLRSTTPDSQHDKRLSRVIQIFFEADTYEYE